MKFRQVVAGAAAIVSFGGLTAGGEALLLRGEITHQQAYARGCDPFLADLPQIGLNDIAPDCMKVESGLITKQPNDGLGAPSYDLPARGPFDAEQAHLDHERRQNFWPTVGNLGLVGLGGAAGASVIWAVWIRYPQRPDTTQRKPHTLSSV